MEELSGIIRKDADVIKAELKNLESYTPLRNKAIHEIAQKYHLSKKDLQIFIDFGLALDGRNEAEYIVSFGGFYLLLMYKEFARRLNVSVDELRMIFEKEVVYCLLNKISPKLLIKKKGKTIAWGYNQKLTKRVNFSESESEELFVYAEKLHKDNEKNTEGVNKGICASPGIVIGKAKIVSNPSENNKVEEGEILITHATTVDYLPSMKKAGAVVTEVGGLTCHAAVVSREFNIPCIVSFRDAMTLFKDGDLIEVDANKGLINRKNE